MRGPLPDRARTQDNSTSVHKPRKAHENRGPHSERNGARRRATRRTSQRAARVARTLSSRPTKSLQQKMLPLRTLSEADDVHRKVAVKPPVVESTCSPIDAPALPRALRGRMTSDLTHSLFLLICASSLTLTLTLVTVTLTLTLTLTFSLSPTVASVLLLLGCVESSFFHCCRFRSSTTRVCVAVIRNSLSFSDC